MGRVAEAAAALEEAFRSTAPKDGRKRPTEADWAAALASFHGEARRIRERYRLGVLGRAAAAYRLQQRLLAAGFPADAVRQVVFSMVLSAFVGKQ